MIQEHPSLCSIREIYLFTNHREYVILKSMESVTILVRLQYRYWYSNFFLKVAGSSFCV